MTELTTEQKLTLIYRHTHADFKGKLAGGQRSIMIYRDGTMLVTLNGLTEAEIAERLPYALKKEDERKAQIAAKKLAMTS